MGRPPGAMSEAAWQGRVLDYATLRGWRWYHTHDSRRSVAGFPDLVLVRERVVFAELKSQRGRLTREQEQWRQCLERAGAEVHVWRPGDWPTVMQVLGNTPADPDGVREAARCPTCQQHAQAKASQT